MQEVEDAEFAFGAAGGEESGGGGGGKGNGADYVVVLKSVEALACVGVPYFAVGSLEWCWRRENGDYGVDDDRDWSGERLGNLGEEDLLSTWMSPRTR